MKDLIEEAIKMGCHACENDIRLIIKLMQNMGDSPIVVMLGAGGGTMTHAVFGTRPNANMTPVDIDVNNLGWEQLALKNNGFNGNHKQAEGS